MQATLAILLICVLPPLLVTALAVITTRLRFRLGEDYTGWVLAGALIGGPAIWVAMAGVGSIFRPEVAEYDFLMNLALMPVGSVLGAATVLLFFQLRGHERTTARNVLLLLLPSLALPVTGLRDVFRLPEHHMQTTGTTAYWLGVYGLPVMWLAALWLAWGWWGFGSRHSEFSRE